MPVTHPTASGGWGVQTGPRGTAQSEGGAKKWVPPLPAGTLVWSGPSRASTGLWGWLEEGPIQVYGLLACDATAYGLVRPATPPSNTRGEPQPAALAAPPPLTSLRSGAQTRHHAPKGPLGGLPAPLARLRTGHISTRRAGWRQPISFWHRTTAKARHRPSSWPLPGPAPSSPLSARPPRRLLHRLLSVPALRAGSSASTKVRCSTLALAIVVRC